MELRKDKAAVVSLRYNAAHLSYLIGLGKAFRELGYEVDYLLNPEYARFDELWAIAPVLPVNGNGLSANGHSHAVFLNPSVQNHNVASSLKRSGARILYVYHEPWKYSLEYLIGEGLRWPRIALAHQASKVMLKVSDAVILPSEYAAQVYAEGDVRYNSNAHCIPTMYDDEGKGVVLQMAARKYFSYIGAICGAHGFDQYVAFMKRAFARGVDLRFMIASKDPLPDYVLKNSLVRDNQDRVEVVCGRALSSEEINKCYAQSFCVWNLYRRVTQSGVLVKSFMFGAPVIASRTGSFPEFVKDGLNGRFASIDDHAAIETAALDVRERLGEYTANCRKTFVETFFYRTQLPEFERLLTSNGQSRPQSGRMERTLKSLGESPRLRRVLKEHVPRGVIQKVADLLGKGREGRIDLGGGAMLSYELNDVYWTQYARNPRGYEPELWQVLENLAGPNTLFIDGGANIGFWSVVAASRIKNKDRVIAIEASDAVLPRLIANQKLNAESFTVLPRAVWSNSDETLTFTVSSVHSASGLVDDGEFPALRKIQVRTISVDDVVRDAARKNIRNPDVIVKLDVEGTEWQALEGMQGTLKTHNTLLIYEDHSKDKASETTTRFLAGGLNLYYVDGDTRTTRAIRDAKELEAIKTLRHRGYNFIACVPGSKFDAAFRGFCQASC